MSDYVIGTDILSATKYRRLEETISMPKRVVVSIKGRPQSEVFEGNVKSVRTVGGERWIPAWDKTSHNYSNADSCVVVLLDGSKKKFNKLSIVQTFGGTVEKTDYIGSDYKVLGALDICVLGAADSLADVRAGKLILKKGDKGEGVTYVQALVGVVADGDYGNNTEKAVKEFQKKYRLTVDGKVGKETIAALDMFATGKAIMPAGGGKVAFDPFAPGAGSKDMFANLDPGASDPFAGLVPKDTPPKKGASSLLATSSGGALAASQCGADGGSWQVLLIFLFLFIMTIVLAKITERSAS